MITGRVSEIECVKREGRTQEDVEENPRRAAKPDRHESGRYGLRPVLFISCPVAGSPRFALLSRDARGYWSRLYHSDNIIEKHTGPRLRYSLAVASFPLICRRCLTVCYQYKYFRRYLGSHCVSNFTYPCSVRHLATLWN